MNELQVFKSDRFGEVRTVLKDGEPWFVAADVCRVLEHTNSRMAVSGLDDDEKGVSPVYTPGGMQDMQVVSQYGLYSLVLSSRKKEAKAFRRWITHEVLPSIFNSGMYLSSVITDDVKKAVRVVNVVARLERELKALKQEVSWLQGARRVDSSWSRALLQGGYANETHPASKIFIETINEMIDNGDVKVIDLEDAAQVRANIGANVIGFEDEDYLYVMSVKAFHWVTERCRARGEAFPSQKALNRALREAGMIEWDATARRSTRVKMVGGKPMRLLWIKRRALEKE